MRAKKHFLLAFACLLVSSVVYGAGGTTINCYGDSTCKHEKSGTRVICHDNDPNCVTEDRVIPPHHIVLQHDHEYSSSELMVLLRAHGCENPQKAFNTYASKIFTKQNNGTYKAKSGLGGVRYEDIAETCG